MLRFSSGARARAFAFLCITIGACVLLVSAAAADVSPTGPTSVSAHITFNFKVFGTPAQLNVDGTLAGTVDNAGKLNFPKSGIHFDDALNQTWGNTPPVVVSKVSPSASGDWTGSIDPETGTVALTGSLIVDAFVKSPLPTPNGCPVGPIPLEMSTEKTGGAKYDLATGSATVADDQFVVEPLLEDPPGQVDFCEGHEAIFNSALSLPTAPGAATVALKITFDEPLEGSGTVVTFKTTTTAPKVTVAAAASTTTTATAAHELPRTGGSSLPLTIFGGSLIAAGAVLIGRRRFAR
jgi:LPXTG-motif cell wall-anchored protein